MPTKRLLLLLFILFVLAATTCGAAALPSITVASHNDRQTVHDSTVTLSGTASDPAKVASIAMSLNRGPWTEAQWNGSMSNPQENASWSIRLELSEGANVIVVNATNAANESATRTLLIDYSIRSSDNSGVILAGGLMLAVIVLIALVAFRVKRAPPPPDEENGQTVEKRLGRTGEGGKEILDQTAGKRLERTGGGEKGAPEE